VLLSIIKKCRSGKVVNLDLILMFGNEISPGGHPLLMTKGVQLTALIPVYVDCDSHYSKPPLHIMIHTLIRNLYIKEVCLIVCEH
jgi:hypothetical protein